MDINGIHIGTAKIAMCRKEPIKFETKIIPMTLFGGVILLDLPKSPNWELWHCDIQLIPHRKYTDYIYPGAKLDNILTDDFLNLKLWKKQIKE